VPIETATANENPVLPHDARAGAARTSVILSQAIDLGTNPDPDQLADVLARLVSMMQAALADVDRFVPDGFRQTAADEAGRMIGGL
jgi:hypothetical protein